VTGWHTAYIVVLDENWPAENPFSGGPNPVLAAIRMVRGVASVQPAEADYGQVIARGRRDGEWADALIRLARSGQYVPLAKDGPPA
jgi:hypothetical protein